jgi:hypothetical protein
MSASGDVRPLYESRLAARKAALAFEDSRHLRVGNVRIVVFLAAVAMFFSAFIGQSFSRWWLLVPVGILIVIGRQLQRIELGMTRLGRAVAFYERGLARLDDRWSGDGDDGARFLEESHLYAVDLDIVGEGSLFQLLSAARTERGLETLARWLLTRAPVETIADRQVAVRELAPRLDLREEMAISGDQDPRTGAADALVGWATDRLPHQPTMARAGTWMLSVLGSIAVLAGVTYLLATFGLLAIDEVLRQRLAQYFAVVASVCIVVQGRSRRWTKPVFEHVFRAERDLGLLAGILEGLERETFVSPYLVSLRAALVTAGQPASQRIRRLQRLVSFLNARRNELVRIVGPLVLWDVHLGHAIEDWRRASGRSVGEWLRAIGEFEAVASFAAFVSERSRCTFPEFVSTGPLFDASGLHHPLLPRDRAVPNDVSLSAERSVLVVSGSNMSGKSTLLRTIGVNAVLAQAGSAVCADGLRISPLAVGASIRIQDSLQEGTSRFYAEISKLSHIMTTSRGPVPVLFLVDEFLHGTNSHDRLIGAEAVVRGLVEHGAIGLITTHDLALTNLVETLGTRATNVHFQDYLEGGRMRFDYRMRPGVVQHSNALALMRAVGLDV